MKTLKKWGWWIAAGVTALFIAIRLWMRFRAREKIIEEWTASTTEHQEDIRKLEKQSKAQAKEAQEELNKIDESANTTYNGESLLFAQVGQPTNAGILIQGSLTFSGGSPNANDKVVLARLRARLERPIGNV